MKVFFRNFSILCLILFVTIGCAMKTGTSNIKDITEEQLSSILVKGKTTQTEVMDKFGVPSSRGDYTYMVGTRQEKGTTWYYKYTESRGDVKQFIPVIGAAFSGNSSNSSRNLNIFFDKNKIVHDYTFNISDDGSEKIF